MKYLLLPLAILGFLACAPTPDGAGSQPKNQKYVTFEFSKDIATMDVRDPGNWCIGNFGESALISADPKNFHRRLFALSDIPTKIVVELGHQSTALMLSKTGEKVEIYTSDNQPACLSNKANFQVSPDGLSFRYDNKRDMKFDVYLQELSSGIQIALDLPQVGNYGLNVVRCESCK